MPEEQFEQEPEWDSEDSGRYQDGYEQGEADARDAREPAPAMRVAMPRPWTEGYEDGRAAITGALGGTEADHA